VFKEPKEIPPKRDVEKKIQLFLDSPLSNIGLYKQSGLDSNDVKKQLLYLLEWGVIRPSTSHFG
jgi:hypothetical protein